MAKYTVKGRYSAVVDSGGRRQQVSLAEGSSVELDDDVAEFVLRDAPGVIEPAKSKSTRGRRSRASDDEG